MYDVLYKFLTR